MEQHGELTTTIRHVVISAAGHSDRGAECGHSTPPWAPVAEGAQVWTTLIKRRTLL